MSASLPSSYLEANGLQLVWDKIFILEDENGARVETEIFFSLPFELVLAPFVDKLHNLYEWKPGMTGTMPFSPVSMMKAILYAKFHKNMSDRALERTLLRNSALAQALGFSNRIPSHQTFSYFKRERLSVEFLEEIFTALRDYIIQLGIVDFSSVTIDSAPLIAHANLPKANREVKLDDSLAYTLFLNQAYQTLAFDYISTLGYKKSFPEHLKKRLACLNILLLYELGGFLSVSKVCKYLEKSTHQALLQAVAPDTGLPSDVTISNFKKKFLSNTHADAFLALKTYLEDFFASLTQPYESQVELSFPSLFGVLQSSCTMVDPDARLGYSAAKKQKFLGYRVQLLIDDKKKYL